MPRANATSAPTPLLRELLEISSSAAEVILKFYSGSFAIEYKTPGDPVTEADRVANALICSRLAEAFPRAAIVAEESAPEEFRDFGKAEQIFFVDPLDGTREFIARNGEFVVMIGLVENERVRAGAIHAPALDCAWCGEVGFGAWRISGGTAAPIGPSTVAELPGARLVVSRSRTPKKLTALAERAGLGGVVPIGSAGLKGAAIAEGKADLYISTGRAGYRWDVCAAEALVVAAGGAMTDAYGRPFDYRSAELENLTGIAAANSELHPKLIDWLEQGRREASI